MILQSTILKTKKRLSDDSHNLAIVGLGLVGLSFVFAFLVRTTTLPHAYGLVRGTIPVIPIAVDDPSLVAKNTASAETNIDKSTPMIALTFDAFYFGALDAFGSGFYRQDNKFRVPHVDNQPQVGNLLRDLGKWQQQRDTSAQNKSVALLMPMSGIPMPIIIQVMHHLRERGGFKQIVLANGVL